MYFRQTFVTIHFKPVNTSLACVGVLQRFYYETENAVRAKSRAIGSIYNFK